MTGRVGNGREPVSADPRDVRNDVIVLAEDETRSGDGNTVLGAYVPFLQRHPSLIRRVLMVPVWLFGHEEIAVDDLVANPLNGRQPLEVLGGKSGRNAHGGDPVGQARARHQYTAAGGR